MIAMNYGDDALRLTPRVSLGETDSSDQSKLWTAVAALATAGYFAPDQMAQLDQLIGMPVRLPPDPEDGMTPGSENPTNPPGASAPANGPAPTSTGGRTANPGTDGGLQPENENTPSRPTRAAPTRKAG
jgi:hypothetical protein